MRTTEEVRRDFPEINQKIAGQPLVYLDSAATAFKPRSVIEALENFYRFEAANVHRGAHYLSDKATQRYEDARAKVAQFIGAKSPNEVVFTRGTTESLNLVAQSYARHFLSAGDEIILSQLEHHSNIVPWHMVATELQLKIKVIPALDSGELDFAKFTSLLSPKTKLLALTMRSNAIGTGVPVKKFIDATQAVGAKVVLDAAQGVLCQRVDVQELNCDFLAFSGHKLFGPFGIGVLYGRYELLDSMPPYQGGGSMISHVSFDNITYLGAPFKFEAGTPNISGVVGLGRAVDYVNGLGTEWIAQHERQLLSLTREQLRGLEGLREIGAPDTKTNIFSFIFEGVHPSDVGQLLDKQGVAVRAGHHCAQPLMERFGIPGTVRASFSVYNNEDDVTRFVQALKKVRGFF